MPFVGRQPSSAAYSVVMLWRIPWLSRSLFPYIEQNNSRDCVKHCGPHWEILDPKKYFTLGKVCCHCPTVRLDGRLVDTSASQLHGGQRRETVETQP